MLYIYYTISGMTPKGKETFLRKIGVRKIDDFWFLKKLWERAKGVEVTLINVESELV